MINLTEFIGQKLNNKQHFSDLKRQQLDKQVTQNRKHFHDESFSSKSLGLSTILDLQNQQQNFAGLGISIISNNSSARYKQSNRQKHIDAIKNTKNQLEEMKQRRKHLQQKVNHTLSKQQFSKNMKGQGRNFYQSGEEKQSYLRGNSQRNIDVKNQNSLQDSHQEFRQVTKKSFDHSHNSSYSQSSFSSLKQQQSNSELLQFNSSQLNREPDRFLSFLRKDIYKLKCEKFLHFIRMFKNKWLIKKINQWIDLSKIIKRQQTKLCRFVFISWKRHVNEQNRKLIMADMIRKRIQQKKNQIFEIQKNNQQNNQQQLSKPEPRLNWRDLSNSRATLREFSPIRPNKDTEVQQNEHELSYYDQYSCITEMSALNHQEQQQQFIK